jgi:hypothetical protein
MDQVKEQLAVVLKYGFWIGSAIVLIGALAIWFLATSDLDQQTEKQIRDIKSDVSTVADYRSKLPTQPNDISHEQMKEMIDERKQEVLQAWQKVFDQQRDILTWPDKMQDEFLNEFKYAKDPETGKVDKNKLKLPFEKYETHPPTEEDDNVPPFLLRRYAQYIGEVLPSYAAIAKAEWTADFDKAPARGGMGMEMEMGMDAMMSGGPTRRKPVGIEGTPEEPVVKWSTSSQDAVLKDLFPWRGKKEYPSELDVYYSQENLWILRQLLQIVRAVNGDAEQPFEAKIREIKKLSIGASVAFDKGSISEPGSNVTAGFGGMGMGMEMEMDMMGEGMDMYSEEAMGGSGMGGTEDAVGADPGDERYVNTAFEPITASTLRGAFTSNDPNQVAIAVAKRVPVMMRLQMDQRSVSRLLAACGSAPLMVDVHQVRQMPKGAASSSGGMDMGMGMEMEMDMGMGMGMEMGSGAGMPGAGGAGSEEEFPMDLDVEIYGLIYFYNPPSEEALGIEKVTEDTSIDESAEVVEAQPTPAQPSADDGTTSGQPATGQPATGQPAAGQPATGQPAATPPGTGQPDPSAAPTNGAGGTATGAAGTPATGSGAPSGGGQPSATPPGGGQPAANPAATPPATTPQP